MPFLSDVFISYCRKDSRIVCRVVKDLEEEGLKIWHDKGQIFVGERFREAVNEGIRNSRVVLVFISSNSLRSRWVLDELDMAMHREKRELQVVVYPILIGRVSEDSKNFPEDLKGKAYIDLRYNFEHKYRKLRTQLVSSIRISANLRAAKGGRTIAVGEPLIRFFATTGLSVGTKPSDFQTRFLIVSLIIS